MSVVTSVVLIASVAEAKGVLHDDEDGPPRWFEEMNAWLLDKSGCDKWQLALVEEHFGGHKHPQTHTAGGGFNHFHEKAFVQFVLAWPWDYPEQAVLVMHPENGAARVFRPAYGHESDLS